MRTISGLETDGYKFSMAEAGWPLRTETFYYSHRKGGLQVLPIDVQRFVRRHLPRPEADDYVFLSRHGYEMGGGFRAAIELGDRLVVATIPEGARFCDREPVFTLTGPSALVSWLEPLLLQIHFRIQVATEAIADPTAMREHVRSVTCEGTRQVVLETLDAVGVEAPEIEIRPEEYHERVLRTARELVSIVEDPRRIFEVGLRSAVCFEEHEIALVALKEAGIRLTSHVELARRLGMVPVGTMGHEHVQRYGSDPAAFRAMVERRPGRASFLLDTFDTIRSGLPTALSILRERPGVGDSIRYDSGDKQAQYRHACQLARDLGLEPVHVLEDGFTADLTREFESMRREEGVAPRHQIYGYGGYLIAKPSGSVYQRDRVAAVWKLTESGSRPTMKFGDEPGGGKESIPGRPVVFRRNPGESGPFGIIGQQDEAPPKGYYLLTGSPAGTGTEPTPADRLTLQSSPATRELVQALRRDRSSSLPEAATG